MMAPDQTQGYLYKTGVAYNNKFIVGKIKSTVPIIVLVTIMAQCNTAQN